MHSYFKVFILVVQKAPVTANTGERIITRRKRSPVVCANLASFASEMTILLYLQQTDP